MKNENLYTPGCIRTFSGEYIDILNPRPEQIHLEDIAHALSHQCRFAGHLPVFYSVAQHSIHCCDLVEDRDQRLSALLHDASEAYLLDIPTPVKSQLANYEEIERNLMTVVAQKFGFDYPLHDAVKAVDKTMLEKEWESLMLGRNKGIMPLSAEDAKWLFLSHAHLLTATTII